MEKKGIIQEFKEFISRGNVMDMAVGVIVGGAFTTIVNSLVNDILMPIIGILLGGVDFTDLKYVITPATDTAAEAAIRYGQFIQNIVNFIIVAWVIFLVVKAMNKMRDMKKKEEEAPAEEPEEPKPSEEVLLLTEIRDLLKKDA